MNVNPPFVILALAAGFLFSWFFVVVKTVTREVPVARALADAVDASAADPALALVASGAAAAPAAGTADAAASLRALLERGVDRLTGRAAAREPVAGPSAPVPMDPGAAVTPAAGTPAAAPEQPAQPAEPAGAAEAPRPAAPRAAVAAPHALPRDPSEVVFRAPGEAAPPVVVEAGAAPAASGADEGDVPSEQGAPLAAPASAETAEPLPPAIETGPDEAPAGYAVKGDRRAKLYLVPGDPDFDRAKPDIWFLDEDAALDAGYAHYLRRPAEG